MPSGTEGWRKSSRSSFNGNCLEWAFRKSSYSTNNGQCTEAALRDGVVLVRDSKDPTGPRLAFSPAQWQAFTCALKAV